MLNPSTDPDFTGRIDAPDASFPYGSARDAVVENDPTATPLLAKKFDDDWGFDAALLTAAGLTPTGDPDTALASQRLTAINLLAVARALNVSSPAVISSENTATILDSVLYIYDSVAQVVQAKPINVGAGETIVTLSGFILTTSAAVYIVQAITPLSSLSEPLGNKNVYFRTSMVPSPEDGVAFPPTSGLTGDYIAGQQVVWGLWAGVAGVSDVVITDDDGMSWGGNSVEMRYEIENTTLFSQGDETIYIVGGDGIKRWLKVSDSPALTSTMTVNLLTVVVDFDIFAELGITSIREMGLQDVIGIFPEKNASTVIDSMSEEILAARTIKDVTGSRSTGVTYTNDTDAAIEMTLTTTDGLTASLSIAVDNQIKFTNGWTSTSLVGLRGSVVVPRGKTYSLLSVAPAILEWVELRVN